MPGKEQFMTELKMKEMQIMPDNEPDDEEYAMEA